MAGKITEMTALHCSTYVDIDESLNVDGDLDVGGDTSIGNATSDKVGFFGVTPVDQPATIADPTDGASSVVAITAIIDRLQELGLIA